MESKLVKCGKLNISNTKPFTLIAGPCQLENEKHALDVANAYIDALKVMLLKENLGSYDVYNLGSGTPISVREIVSVVEQNLGEHINVVWGNPSTVDIPIAYADLTKIKKELSWTPSYSIHEGIANTIKYYRNKDIG